MKCESACSQLALLCFAINHTKRCAERAVGAVKQLAGHGEKTPEKRGRESAKEHGIKNESVLTQRCY